MEWECKLQFILWFERMLRCLDTAAFHHHSAVIVLRTVIEKNVLRVHLCTEDFSQFFSLAMEHLGLEPFIHAVFGPFCVGIEVEIPVVDSRNMYTISIQLNHVHMIAAVLVAFLICDDDEERIWGYGVDSAHGGAKIAN